MSEALAKCEAYHAWGVETAWIVDPEARRAWEYTNGQCLSEVPESGELNHCLPGSVNTDVPPGVVTCFRGASAG